MQEALIKDVFADEEFVKRLLCLETPQEVQAAMSGKGIDLTVDQIVKIKELVVKRLDAGQELSDEELEDVTGGSILVLGLTLAAASAVAGSAGIRAGGGGISSSGAAWCSSPIWVASGGTPAASWSMIRPLTAGLIPRPGIPPAHGPFPNRRPPRCSTGFFRPGRSACPSALRVFPGRT